MNNSKLKRILLHYWFLACDGWNLFKCRSQSKLKIMTDEQTISYIQKHRCSISRFGDGEFAIMLQRGGPEFQQASKEMAAAMEQVFENHSSELLICLPHAFNSTKGFEDFARSFWDGWVRDNLMDVSRAIRKRIGYDYRFGDAYISRPYTAYKSKKRAAKLFTRLKTLWYDRDILIVEGEKTRLGIGNDLFAGVRSIKRILGPAENAFSSYSRILNTVVTHWNGELVILALGPTATILASDLSLRDIQALDLGHVDIQYEWFLADSKAFKPIPGKYTNEAVGGRTADACEDPEYLSQIIAKVE